MFLHVWLPFQSALASYWHWFWQKQCIRPTAVFLKPQKVMNCFIRHQIPLEIKPMMTRSNLSVCWLQLILLLYNMLVLNTKHSLKTFFSSCVNSRKKVIYFTCKNNFHKPILCILEILVFNFHLNTGHKTFKTESIIRKCAVTVIWHKYICTTQHLKKGVCEMN